MELFARTSMLTQARTRTLAALALLTACMPGAAQAVGLGEATVYSALSQPFRMEVPVFGDGLETLSDACFQVARAPQTPTDDLPWLKEAQIHFERQGERGRLIVTTRQAVQHPAMGVGIVIQCGGQVRRDFMVLLGPPDMTQATLATSEIPAQPAPAIRKEAPPPRKAQRPPALRRAAPVAEGQTATPPRAQVTAPRETRPRRAAPAHRDRLEVSRTEGELALRPASELGDARTENTDTSTRARLRREQQLVLAIDDRISTELELAERIRQLEYKQTKLQEENQRLQALLNVRSPTATVTSSAPARAVASTPGWVWMLGVALLAMLASLGVWFARRRREPAPTIETRPYTPLASAQRAPDLDMDVELEPLTTADIWPDRAQDKPSTSGEPAVDWAPATVSPATLGPSSLLHIDDAVEEHDSAVELAEIMMSFGRVHGAAETLADFIRANPKQAVKPWVKLLEVYRSANMRVEFDALAQQLNKTFNVKAVCWEEFDEVARADDTLEKMAHITHRIIDTWGTRGCQAYIYTLLRDNRKGTRQGFPIGIVDDLLCLSGVLETLMGAFKPTPEELAAALAQPDSTPTAPPPAVAIPTDTPELDLLFTPPDDFLEPPQLPDFPGKAPTHVQSFTHAQQDEEHSGSMIEFNLDEAFPSDPNKDR